MKSIIPYGDSAVLIQFENEISHEVHLKVISLYKALRHFANKGITSIIPAYNSITVIYNTKASNFFDLSVLITHTWENLKTISPTHKTTINIPVCYDHEFALDVKEICNDTNLNQAEIIRRHTAPDYLVYMLGFVPGFLYLGGMDEKIATPRKLTPRLKTPKGAVGIAGRQTGIYPLETPGGWQIIGQTPIELFNINTPLVEAGDYVRFYSINKTTFIKLKNESFVPVKETIVL